MGQLAEKDSRPQLPIQISQDNVRPVSRKNPFTICPFLMFQSGERIFFIDHEQQLESVYKFGSYYTVHLQLKKQDSKKQSGIYLKLADDYVYAYKHRKLDRSDKIKPQKLLFKKRMYAHLEKGEKSEQSQQSVNSEQLQKSLILRFAQLKLLSLLQVGPKLGRVYNGCDGIITEDYIEYFSEVTIDKIENCIPKNSELKELERKLIEKGFYYQGMLKNQNLSYSRWRKGYVLKQLHYYQNNIQIINPQSLDNQSIHYIVRIFQTEVTKAIMDLDNQAKMLPFINNLIFQHDFQKAISKFEESLPMIQDDDEKLDFAQEVTTMIAKHTHNGKQYKNKIQKIISNSRFKEHSKDHINSPINSKTASIESMNSKIKDIHTPDKSIQSITEQNTDFISPVSEQSPQIVIQGQLKGYSLQQKQNVQIQNQAHYQSKVDLIKIQDSKKKIAFTENCKVLRTYILDKNNKKIYETLNEMLSLKYKSNIQIQILFGKILIQNARSRHALAVFERLLFFSNQIPFSQVYYYHQVALLAGILYFHRYSYNKALKSFQKALSILVRLRHYSIKMMTIYNNIACIFHVLKNYDQSIIHLHRGFRLGQYSVDYQYLMRSNMAMNLAQTGKIKQAKAEMMKINKIVQPINSMVIFCKFYTNLAYIELIDAADNKGFEKSLSNFQQACNIEEKYLIPNGYRPSIFLHNNIAMIYYKRKEFKKAKFHSEKIVNELNDVQGLVAIKVHFNIGKIFSQGYNYDLPLKHFHEARILLSKMDQSKDSLLRTYPQKICKEIQQLQRMRIDEVSEEQSHKFSYMSSSLLKKV